MRRIEFIAPVEAMRGNLSGRQNLVYAENDNPAYEAPNGRNYARNYSPRYIGSKRSSDNRKYFAVKTRAATNLNAASRQTMALLGGAGAIYSSMLRRKDLQPYTTMERLYRYNVDTLGYTGTFRRFAMDFLREGLQNKVQNFTANAASIVVSFKNPWYDGTMTDGATVSTEVLVKFWLQLAPNAISFEVRRQPGIAQTAMTFGDLINNTSLNVLGIIAKNSGANPYTGIGDYFLLTPEGDYVLQTDAIVANMRYTLTPVTPA